MLKQRIVTAIILCSILLGILWSGNTWLFSGFIIICLFTAALEWAALSGLTRKIPGLIYAMTAVILLVLFRFLFGPGLIIPVFVAGTTWWCLAAVCIFAYQKKVQIIPGNKLIRLIIGMLVLFPACLGLLQLFELPGGNKLVLVLFLIIWFADSAAYFAGKKFGNYRLASKVSPGKSWEGVVGSFFSVIILAILFSTYFNFIDLSLIFLLPVFIMTMIFSIIGDLFESMFKRDAGVKDSGQLLPGHGGVMDRIDSLTSATPIFVLSILLLGQKT